MRTTVVALALCCSIAAFAADLPSDVAAQVAKFKDADPKVRQQAVAAVGRMGEKAKPALPNLVEMLNDKTTWVVTKTLMSLRDIGPDEATLKAVTPFLGLANEVEKRDFAAEVFAAYGEKAVPMLVEALKDDLKAEGAIVALELLGPKAKEAAKPLQDVAAKHKSKPVRDRAAKAAKLVSK